MDIFDSEKTKKIDKTVKDYNEFISILSSYFITIFLFIPAIICFIISMTLDNDIITYISYGFIALGTLAFIVTTIVLIIYLIKRRKK